MRATMKKCLLMVTTVVGFASLHACDKADEIFDCQSVCKRYAECYDPKYDVDGCRTRCRNASANNPSIRNDADECNACIDDKSCLAAPFSCGGPCGTIVP